MKFTPKPTSHINDMTIKTGKLTPRNPAISIVIMSVNSSSMVSRAIESVITHHEYAEIIVVNTGEGTLTHIISKFLEKIILIETSYRQYAGGTRNIGIKHAKGPVVAFLASDCVASENWVSLKLKRHSEGHKMVATAIEPLSNKGGKAGLLERCAYLYIHRERIPEISIKYSSPYGLSYNRDLFTIFGLFNESLQTNEDFELNRNIMKFNQPLWDKEIIYYHEYPRELRDLISDFMARGRRQAFYSQTQEKRSLAYIVARSIKRNFDTLVILMKNKEVIRKRGFSAIFLGYFFSFFQCVGHFASKKKVY